ncbi:unnamed protein product, partial [marine sediment metagenome]
IRKFIGVENYSNQYGEVANISLLTNVDTNNAKQKDLDTLKSVNDNDLNDIAKSYTLPFSTLTIALAEMIASGEKNLSEDKSKRTNQSNAQADAYIHLTPAVRMHKETMDVFVAGFLNNKTVLVEGDYPVKNKREKTLCKDAIAKHCDLRMKKYRQYKVGQMDAINVTGSTLQML